MTSSTNRIGFLLSVCECKGHRRKNITMIIIRRKGGVRNGSEVGLKMDEKYK